ncbi:hypothetical protein KPL70_021386 [Citrus sinensis]|nr:hypothetical protein KPL70_021386 [Citrus sinensis]
MPLEWISNYEKFHTNTSHIQTTESMFERRADGTVRMTFRPPSTAPKEPPRLSFTSSAMVTAVQTAQEKLPITGFTPEGYLVYPAKLNGHFLWDALRFGNCDPDCPCWDDWDEDEAESRRRRKSKKKTPKTPCPHNQPKPPHDPPPPPAPLPIYRKELRWIAKHCKTDVLPHIQNSHPPREPMALVITKPFIPSAITPTGHLEDPKPFEAVLNWQTQNARAQNETLDDIHKKKEKEIRKLKVELEQIESERQRPTLFTTSPLLPPLSPAFHPFAPMLSPIKPQDPSKLFSMTYTLFRNNPLPKPSRSKPHPRPRPEKQPFQPPLSSEQQQPLYTPLPSQPTPTQAKDKSPMQQYSAQLIPDPSDTDQTSDSNLAVSEDPSEPESESSVETSLSSSDSEKSYADITRILMAQPEEIEPAQSSRTDPFFEIPSDIEEDAPEASSAPNRPAQPPNDHKPSNGPWFTFDDIPASKWRDRLSEMAAWTDLQMLRANATTASVLRELATRFTGSLKDWFDTLGEYRQLQFVQLPNVSTALSVIHEQFIGESATVFEANKRSLLMKTVFALQNSSNDSESDEFQTVFHQQLLSLDTTIPILSIKLHILPSKFQRPIPAIGLLDTGAQRKSHADFHHPNPLWKNLHFFVQLPSKLNEDVNPTKATHPGMSPSDLVLAQKECSQLLAQGTQDDHCRLLNQFFDITQSHGIMLSSKKSTIATNNIEFLGMTIKDGHYQPGKHIVQELIHFPDQNLSKRQIQQFLGISNYIRDFIPHVDHHTRQLLDPGSFQRHFRRRIMTQDQVFEWFTTPHPSILEQDDKVQKELYNFLCELNHQPAPHKDISHTSLGPRHDIIMIPTPSAISKLKSTGIIIKEEKPDFTDILYQDAQDSWEAFLPLSQHLQNLQQTPPSHASDDPTNKASSSKPPGSNDHPSSDWRKIFCPYPPCRPDHQHPPETPCPSLKVLFSKDKDEIDSSSDEDYMNLSSP